jgi:hypothetical protein
MKKVVLLSTAVVLFGFSTAFALSEDVERDKFLGTLGARSEMVSSINSNALHRPPHCFTLQTRPALERFRN